MTAPLIAARWRRAAVLAAVLGAALATTLGAIFFHGGSTSLDDRVLITLSDHIDSTGARVLLVFTMPTIAGAVVLITAAFAWWQRRRDVAAVVVLSPIVGVLLSSEVLKPALGRHLGPVLADGQRIVTQSGTYPSGHETGVTCTALVLFLACCQFTRRRRTRLVVGVLLAGWIVAAALALVRNHYHYATDTIGALGVSTAVVLTIALLIDRLFRRAVEPPPVRRYERADQAG